MKSYSPKELIDMAIKVGWFEVSCVGSHHKFHHKEFKGILIIPHPKKDMPIGTAKSILKMIEGK